MKEELKKVVDKWLKEADRLSDEAGVLFKESKFDEGRELINKSIAIRECAIDALKLIVGI